MNIVYIDAKERLEFFSRFKRFKDDYILVTHLLSVKLISVWIGVECHLIEKKDFSINESRVLWGNVLESKLDCYNDKELNDIYYSVKQKVIDVISQRKIDAGYVWNGQRIVQKAFADAVVESGSEISYLEITNLPGKMQINKLGVNAQSSWSLSDNIEPLEDLSLWKEYKIAFKKHCYSKEIGQVSLLKKINSWYLIDYLGFVFLSLVRPDKTSFISKIISKIRYKSLSITSESLPEKFNFLPLQVSMDSQILINYDGTISDSIEEALKISKDDGVKLVLKVHPAETNMDLINKIINHPSAEYVISNENTYRLIERSQQVITVNSTVGLEARLLDKNVKYLGTSIYSGLSNEKLAGLVLNEFVDIDYFGKDEIEL